MATSSSNAQRSVISYFVPAIVVGVIGLILGGLVGQAERGAAVGAFVGFLDGVIETGILGVLESSMSLDNAIIIAKILETVSPGWRTVYKTMGLLVSGLGMRFAFPIAIVSWFGGISFMQTLHLALHDPEAYGAILKTAGPQIAAFGGTFLLLIGLGHMMDPEKDDHWLNVLEIPLAKFGGVKFAPVGITLAVLLATAFALPKAESQSFIIAGLSGLLFYIFGKELLSWLIGEPGAEATMRRGGLMTVLYMEFIDASFSFDGVIGALAVTNRIIPIAIGLFIGATMIRCLTLFIVDTKSLAKFAYLEHGAIHAIIALGLMTFAQEVIHIPDVVTGLTGAAIIATAFICSIQKNKADARLAA